MIRDLRGQQPHGRIDSQNDRQEEVLATIPQWCGDTAIEVVMIHNATGATAIELRSLVWGNGLGWYRQHTLQLDGMAARDHRLQPASILSRAATFPVF